jgi:RNA polymerase sigma-70 factor (ECF subfamily)
VLTPVRANGSPSVAVYRPETPGGQPTAFAIHVLDVVAGRISALRSFIDPALFELFSLPNHYSPHAPS